MEYTVAASDLPGRVEDILRKRIGLTPHQIRGARYRQEGICLNGVRVRTAEKVREGDRLQVLLRSGKPVPGIWRRFAAPWRSSMRMKTWRR